jgi:hypothetical protein
LVVHFETHECVCTSHPSAALLQFASVIQSTHLPVPVSQYEPPPQSASAAHSTQRCVARLQALRFPKLEQFASPKHSTHMPVSQ